jgi:hypothetical protein
MKYTRLLPGRVPILFENEAIERTLTTVSHKIKKIKFVKAVGAALPAALLAALTANVACASSIIFSDSFSEPVLNSSWVQLAGTGSYTVGGGQLQYNNVGPVASPSGWGNTSLSLGLPFTGTDWEIDFEASYSLAWCLPGNNINGPAVPNQSCSAGAQEPRVGVSFAPVTATDRSALGNGDFADFYRVTDAWYGSDSLGAEYGGDSVSTLLAPADSTIQNNVAGGTYFYQIIRDGGSLLMNYSTDGVRYTTALSAMLADPANDFNEFAITGTTYLTAGSFASYGPLTIQSETPEPSTLFLIEGGLVLLPLFGGRLRALRGAGAPAALKLAAARAPR